MPEHGQRAGIEEEILPRARRQGDPARRDHAQNVPVREQGNVAVDRARDAGDVDAIVQVSTNLSMVRLATTTEMWLGKPVIAINTATYWHALRQNGIADKIPGLGRLLEDF